MSYLFLLGSYRLCKIKNKVLQIKNANEHIYRKKITQTSCVIFKKKKNK